MPTPGKPGSPWPCRLLEDDAVATAFLTGGGSRAMTAAVVQLVDAGVLSHVQGNTFKATGRSVMLGSLRSRGVWAQPTRGPLEEAVLAACKRKGDIGATLPELAADPRVQKTLRQVETSLVERNLLVPSSWRTIAAVLQGLPILLFSIGSVVSAVVTGQMLIIPAALAMSLVAFAFIRGKLKPRAQTQLGLRALKQIQELRSSLRRTLGRVGGNDDPALAWAIFAGDAFAPGCDDSWVGVRNAFAADKGGAFSRFGFLGDGGFSGSDHDD